MVSADPTDHRNQLELRSEELCAATQWVHPSSFPRYVASLLSSRDGLIRSIW